MPADKLRAATDGRDGNRAFRPRWQGLGWWMAATLGLTARAIAEEPVAAPSLAEVAAQFASEQPEPAREKRILLFTASWCGPCQAMKGDLHNPERTPNAPCARLLKTGWKVGTDESSHIQIVDVDAAPELSDQFAIQSLPTLVLIENGRELRRLEGAADAWAIGKLFKGYDERLSRNDRKTPVAGS
jgi:thioredoxin-like negative regulator of GroEL